MRRPRSSAEGSNVALGPRCVSISWEVETLVQGGVYIDWMLLALFTKPTMRQEPFCSSLVRSAVSHTPPPVLLPTLGRNDRSSATNGGHCWLATQVWRSAGCAGVTSRWRGADAAVWEVCTSSYAEYDGRSATTTEGLKRPSLSLLRPNNRSQFRRLVDDLCAKAPQASELLGTKIIESAGRSGRPKDTIERPAAQPAAPDHIIAQSRKRKLEDRTYRLPKHAKTNLERSLSSRAKWSNTPDCTFGWREAFKSQRHYWR